MPSIELLPVPRRDERLLSYLNTNFRRIADAMGLIGGSNPDTSWHNVGAAGEPAFQNNWVNYSSQWAPCSFRKDANGFVHIRGLISRAAGISGAAIFTLPVGYRTTLYHMFPSMTQTAGGSSLVRSDVYPDGNVYTFQGTFGGAAPSGAVSWLDIFNIQFFADA